MNEWPMFQDGGADVLALENAIFETALAIEEAETRDRFLKRVYHDDPEGLGRMEDLLSLTGESAMFFIESQRLRADLADEVIREMPEGDLPAMNRPAAAVDEPGTRVDRYVVVRKIGEGGCGVVHEAEQEGMERPVALKILRMGMDTEGVVKRFEVERRALGLMDHPNIARVFDAGRTADGRPYFVMELVRGERITTYCEERKLGIGGRLELFVQVCHAIQHAHQKGIIHSDIKPSNILVAEHDGISVPKVIDFGIAKATETPLGDRQGRTSLDRLAGTPAYMSPEQIELGGRDVDTRSDIYSLGALLYDLLAGRPPFDAEELMRAGLPEMRRTLMEQQPPPPSVAAMVDPARAKISQACRGDLDAIVAKAMDKDRNRRYDTANSLAMDIERFSADQPVIARPPSRIYLMGKFFTRNRIACVATAAVALSLLAGFGIATMLYLREKDALAEQGRLKREAVASQAEEARLRTQAQARANVSRVAILLADGQIQEADLLLQQTPLESVEPSLEATDVFRSLGSWNAIYGRWDQALACFRLMEQANRLRDPQEFVEGLDILVTAPAFLEAGDVQGYVAFRDEAIGRYQPCRNSLQAEHLLKACLLLPVDAEMIARLEDAAKMCQAAIPPLPRRKRFPEWEALSLAMFEFRKGNPAATLEWTERCLAFDDPVGTRANAARCIAAMVFQKAGRNGDAEAHLKRVRAALENASEGTNHPTGNWFAWSVVRILLREAEG